MPLRQLWRTRYQGPSRRRRLLRLRPSDYRLWDLEVSGSTSLTGRTQLTCVHGESFIVSGLQGGMNTA